MGAPLVCRKLPLLNGTIIYFIFKARNGLQPNPHLVSPSWATILGPFTTRNGHSVSDTVNVDEAVPDDPHNLSGFTMTLGAPVIAPMVPTILRMGGHLRGCGLFSERS